jgi:hypothetical protein
MVDPVRLYRRQLERYLRDYDATVLANLRAELVGEAADPSPSGFVGMLTCLLSLGADLRIRGEHQVLSGDPKGWSLLFLSMCYDHAVACGRPSLLGVKGVAMLLCAALSFEQDDVADFAGELMLRSYVRDCELPPGQKILGDWGSAPIGPFALRLWLYARGRSEPDWRRGAAADEYAPLFEAWTRPEGFADALYEACELHVEQSRETDSWVIYLGFRLFAPELHAVRKVRVRLGLETPRVEHPILETPLAELPAAVPLTCDDECLALAESRIRRELES